MTRKPGSGSPNAQVVSRQADADGPGAIIRARSLPLSQLPRTSDDWMLDDDGYTFEVIDVTSQTF
jgi:hypothetical protein